MGRIVRYTLAGMLGAIIAWLVMEPTALMPEARTPGVEPVVPYAYVFVIGLVAGLMIGLLLGLAEGLSGLSPRDTVRCAISGALVGAAGGILGLTFGNVVYNSMYQLSGGPPTQSLPANLPADAQVPASTPGLFSFVLLLIGRSFGWAIIGGFIGVSQGIATMSTKKMINGAVGGLLGGAIGGSVFEILAWLNRGGATNFLPGMIRFISFAITGGAIGLFIGFIEELTKKAWLKRLVGRNEGKEYTIYKPVTVIGRDEAVDIPVFGDPDVAERHAKITAIGQRHMVEDLGSFYGISVNGQKVTRGTLHDGDVIEIGKTRFLFRDKATASYSSAESDYARVGVAIPTSEHVCPYCGAVKDANGKCDCTVGDAPAPSPVTADPFQHTAQMSSWPTNSTVAPSPFGAAPVQPGDQARGARLTALAGPYSGKTFPLGGIVQIGREATRDIGLPMDNTVSRSHARIAQEVTGYVLYDEGSTNGTYVNGAKVQRHNLVTGDLVQIGSTKFRFEQ